MCHCAQTNTQIYSVYSCGERIDLASVSFHFKNFNDKTNKNICGWVGQSVDLAITAKLLISFECDQLVRESYTVDLIDF